MAFFMLQFSATAQKRILTIGDSTMADYDTTKYSGEKEQRGWGQMLPAYLKKDVALINAAKNGRSSKSFYYEFWQSLRDTLQPGDYVFIQFGHNDEKADGQDTDETDTTNRGTAAWGQYQKYLTFYVDECRAKGAIPILFTPIVRRLFDEGSTRINDKGLHNLTEFAVSESEMNYPLSMKTLTIQLNVPLIDMTSLTKNLVETMGAEKAKELIYVNSDDTHLKANGAKEFARLAVIELLRQNLLKEFFVTIK